MLYLKWVSRGGDEKASLFCGEDRRAKPRDDARASQCFLRVELYGVYSETLAGLPKAAIGFFCKPVLFFGVPYAFKKVFRKLEFAERSLQLAGASCCRIYCAFYGYCRRRILGFSRC